jgi:hypothetical protein
MAALSNEPNSITDPMLGPQSVEVNSVTQVQPENDRADAGVRAHPPSRTCVPIVVEEGALKFFFPLRMRMRRI